VSNLLIVESQGDKFFIEKLLSVINEKSVTVDEPICNIDDYECLGGIGNLEKKLKFIKSKIKKEGIDKIGIIFDADNIGVEQRTKDIQNSINIVFGDNISVEFKIYIIQVNGKGELEDILKIISTKDSYFADCLEDWKKCLEEKNITITDKIFNKFWINNYIMYDSCNSSKHKGNKSKYCIFEYAIKEKDIWNFDHEILDELKEFLRELGEN